ncbi:hypothetical protein TOK_5968 [Pseudonocardia sp. N23]|nr:hypothetical protein TOK_5968 [Pseudonocardia sp. N23]
MFRTGRQGRGRGRLRRGGRHPEDGGGPPDQSAAARPSR